MSDVTPRYVIGSPEKLSVVFSLTNRKGELVSIDILEIERWLRFRHPILWRRNREMREWFKSMKGDIDSRG